MSNCNCNKLSDAEKATATGVSVVVNDPQTAIKLAMEGALEDFAKKDADNITEPNKWKEKLNYLTEEDIADKADTTAVTELSEKVDTKAGKSDLESAKRDLTAEIAQKASAEELSEAKEDLQGKIDTKANTNADNIANNVENWQQALNIYTQETAQRELDEKVDKEEGKSLTTNDFTNEYKAVLDNLPVELSTETTIKFDRDRDYGTRTRPIDTFTLDLNGAKRGVVNVIFFNGSVLPTPSGLDYGNSKNLFRAGTTQKIVMLFVDNSTILATILS